MTPQTNLLDVRPMSQSSLVSFGRLVLKRPIYIVVSLVLVLLIRFVWHPAPPMPTREYFTTYRVKYSDPGQGDRASKSFGEEVRSFRPQWAMLNPYDRDMAIKYFESTQIIINAGERLNYTVNYWYQGRDIYATSPIDMRFLSDSISAFDRWGMKLELGEQAVTVTSLKGVYAGKKKLLDEPLILPYGQTTDTPIGPISVKLVRPIGKYRKLSLSKMSELDAQDKYDGKMRRFMGGNLIELFLMADCTIEFARDLFHEIGREYERYAREGYRSELKIYLERLAKVKEYLQGTNQAPVQTLGVDLGTISSQGREEMLVQIDRLMQEAQTNALILEQDSMLELVDNALIRSPKQGASPQSYIIFGLALLFVLIPIVATLVEIVLRRPLLGRCSIPESWQTPRLMIPLPKIQAGAVPWDLVRLSLARALPQGRVLLLTSLSADKRTEPIIKQLEHTALLAGEPVLVSRLEHRGELAVLLEQTPQTTKLLIQLPPLDESSLALELNQSLAMPLALILHNASSSSRALDKLHQWYQGADQQPLILWDDTI